MAIINRFFIRRYNIVPIDVPAGTVTDGSRSFTLRSPNPSRNGTSDFLGVVKQYVLLGEVIKDTVNTNPRNLRQDPIPVNRFNQLTDRELQLLVESGEIVLNPDQVIGWVELVKSYPSLYYQDCTVSGRAGKQPVVDNYFDFLRIRPNGVTVVGVGAASDAFRPIGTWNIGETTNQWGTYHRRQGYAFDQYMEIVGRIRMPNIGDTFTQLTGEVISDVPILWANKERHFDGNETVNVPNGIVYAVETTNPMKSALLAAPQNTGQCFQLQVVQVNEDIDEFTQENEIAISDSVPEIPLEVVDDSGEQYLEPPAADDYKLCQRDAILPTRIYYRGKFIGSGSDAKYQYGGDLPISGSTIIGGINDEDVFPVQVMYESTSEQSGIRDPRVVMGNTIFIPNGTFKRLFNVNDCVNEIHDDFRDKDGDIPEYVGPVLVNYHESIRKSMMRQFYTQSPLQLLGHGTDGLEYYSDGNSYLELHGESIFGCGKGFSIADIPEIFNEMYPVRVPREGAIRFGKDDKEDVKFYRKTFERPTQLPLGVLKTLDWLTGLPPRLTDDRATLNDMFNDFVLGVPDLDFVTVGDDTHEDKFKSIIYAAAGGLAAGKLSYLLASDANILDSNLGSSIISGVIAGYTYAQLIQDEHSIYRRPWNVSSVKPRPRTITRYRSFNSFWKRDGLRNVYADTAESDVTNLGTVSQTELYANPVWERKTIEELRITQAKLSYPSRWKAMMRPIYVDLWHDKQQILPKNVSTRRYFGESLLELELGDYETHRKEFGMSKNLYDDIDDALSIRIHPTSFREDISENIREFVSFQTSVQNIDSHIQSFFVNRFANLTGINVTQVTANIEEIYSNFSNLSNLNSYIDLIRNLVDLYGLSSDSFDRIVENPDALLDLFNVKSLTELATAALDMTVNYVITSTLTVIYDELNRANPDRSSFSPRRIFKQGSVYLKSRSGLFITNKQPCPVIFLGFNDGMVLSSFSDFNNQLDCLSTLSKDDMSRSAKYAIVSEQLPSVSLPILTQNNLGSVRMPQPIVENKSVVQYTVPTINKRPRQYGKNPFLDIFYLNNIPESFANNPNTAYSHRTATPAPYRFYNKNDVNATGRFIQKDYSVPSYFPPHWNEPQIREGSPEEFYKDMSHFEHGDLFFMNRQPSTIIPAKDRWEMNMESIGETNVVVLTDKTPILDIYFGLVYLHAHGIPWDELIVYIRDTKRAISIGIDRDYIGRNNATELPVASHLKSSINLSQLSIIWERIYARMQYSTPLYVAGDISWDSVEPILISPNIDNQTELALSAILSGISIAGRALETDLKRTLTLYNNTSTTILVKDVRVLNTMQNEDVFGQNAESLFFAGTTLIPNLQTSTKFDFNRQTLNVRIPPFDAKQTKFESINVWFLPIGVEPGREYTAQIQITAEIDGEEYVISKDVTATVQTAPNVQNWSKSLLELPLTISFGTVNDNLLPELEPISGTQQSSDGGIQIEYRNMSREDLLIEKLEIIDERVFDLNQNDITSRLRSTPNFFGFKNDGSSVGDKTENPDLKTFEYRIPLKMQKPIGDSVPEFLLGQAIFINSDAIQRDGNLIKNAIYSAKCRVTYSLSPRIGTNSRVIKTSTFDINFATTDYALTSGNDGQSPTNV